MAKMIPVPWEWLLLQEDLNLVMCLRNLFGGAPIGAIRYGKGVVWLGDAPLDSIEDANIIENMPIEIGWVVASAGDVNGDGYDEVMFSNYAADSNQTAWVCRYTGPGIEETGRLGDGK
ncbi:MAG: hypothetical protein ABIL70_02205 [candidate division WOR-3 bacterium]